MTVPRWFFALTLGLTLLIYGIMVFWGSPVLTEEAGGLLPFDLRPLGYGAEEARAYLAALSPKGREVYLTVIGPLDTLFPPLLALSLAMAFLRVARRSVALVLSAIAAAGAVLDLLENRATAGLMRLDPAEVTDAAILAASRWTQMKWMADGICLAALAVLLGLALFRRLGRSV